MAGECPLCLLGLVALDAFWIQVKSFLKSNAVTLSCWPWKVGGLLLRSGCVPKASAKHALASEIKLKPIEIGSLNSQKPQLGCWVIFVPEVGNTGNGEEVEEKRVIGCWEAVKRVHFAADFNNSFINTLPTFPTPLQHSKPLPLGNHVRVPFWEMSTAKNSYSLHNYQLPSYLGTIVIFPLHLRHFNRANRARILNLGTFHSEFMSISPSSNPIWLSDYTEHCPAEPPQCASHCYDKHHDHKQQGKERVYLAYIAKL